MKELDKDPTTWAEISDGQVLHLLALGYEERCLTYARFLSKAGLSAKHRFLCLVPPDEHMSWYLKVLRNQHKEEMLRLLPSIHFDPWAELRSEISANARWDACCLDISSLPKHLIFVALEQVLKASRPAKSAFVIYTYPTEYTYGPLQSPGSDVSIHFPEPQLVRGQRAAALLIPGFDPEYTNLAVAYIRGSLQVQPDVRWLLPFPGRKYCFYERALERHIDLLSESKVCLFLQDEIASAVSDLTGQIQANPTLPCFFVPLGSRINCVSVYLAAERARSRGRQVNILYPQTSRHGSIRSRGGSTPLIERLPSISGEI